MSFFSSSATIDMTIVGDLGKHNGHHGYMFMFFSFFFFLFSLLYVGGGSCILSVYIHVCTCLCTFLHLNRDVYDRDYAFHEKKNPISYKREAPPIELRETQ